MRLSKSPIVLNITKKEWKRIKQSSRSSFAFTLIGASIVLTVGLALLVFGVLFMFGINPLRATGSGWGAVIPGGLFAGAGITNLVLAIASRRLVPEEQMHARLNTDEATLRNIIRENSIAPRYIINGERYYAPADFGEIVTLLRAADVPQATSGELLRPAANQAASQTEQLLRASTPAPATTMTEQEFQQVQQR